MKKLEKQAQQNQKTGKKPQPTKRPATAKTNPTTKMEEPAKIQHKKLTHY
ncbi:hypothetical protein INS90_03045 [Trueperella pecoris]|uniref:Uncharacterized protein n=1 Tax=Trueperella pecoris TaxID=2733571 RepID=A0A7M1R3L2_9ACTO|nr:hypothetical protein [Trueperella pecoris]QOR48274.1 hypothetical protein INS90_03020 [Trueperella pecoris]QOR48276.1 hypothetical protein INS90_03045 [Trueperella pecoris]